MARKPTDRRSDPAPSRADVDKANNNLGVCVQCFNEEYLLHLAHKQESQVTCLSCRSISTGVSLELLSEEIAKVLDELYQPSPTEPSGMQWLSVRETGDWAQPGQPLREILESLLGIKYELAVEICQFMTKQEGGWKMLADGGELAFDAGVWYEERSSFYDHVRHSSFFEFEQTLRHTARYFHPASRELLQQMFDGVHTLVGKSGASVCVGAGPDSNYTSFFRARYFEDEETLMKAMRNPELELGPPPPTSARAGRMNAELVSVFYGATDAGTALAEVRPPAYSRVLVGQFEVLRKLRLLDVEAMREVLILGSPLDPRYRERLRHADFLRTLSQRISRPVLPTQQPSDYIATQAIADYLAHEIQPPFDGMIYPTSQGSVGANFVLFANASRVQEQVREEGVSFEADTFSMTEDGPEPDYSIIEWHNDPTAPPLRPKHESDWEDGRLVTMKLRRESLEVHEVRSVRFETIKHEINHIQLDRSEPLNF